MKKNVGRKWRLRGVIAVLVMLTGLLSWWLLKPESQSGLDKANGESASYSAKPSTATLPAVSPDNDDKTGGIVIPEEFKNKPSRAEVRARIEAEKAQLPKLSGYKRLHMALPITDYSPESDVSLPQSRSYGAYNARVVDYRETFTPAALRKDEDPLGTVKCEWLISLDENDWVVIHTDETYAEYEDGRREYVSSSEYSASQITALLKWDVSLLDFNARLEEYGLEFVDVILTNDKCDSLVVINLPFVTLDSVADAREYVESLDMCEYVEVDSVMRPSKIPNDEYYSYQWWLQKISAPSAWDVTTGASSVLVGVVDTGVSWWHPDLDANLWKDSKGIYGWCSFYGGEMNDYILQEVFPGYNLNVLTGDWHGHGTNVSGIIGAITNNSTGVAGINWNSKIVSVNYTFLGADSDYMFETVGNIGFATDSIAGFEFCRKQGCKIINFSSGVTAEDCSSTSIQTFNTGINSLRSNGVILVVAAGNGDRNGKAINIDSVPDIPASLTQDNIVSVGATDSSDNLTSWSNYGTTSVDIAAPGVDDVTTNGYMDIGADGEVYVYTGYGYCGAGTNKTTGTSFSAPIVSGALALMKSKFPNLNYTEMINKLYAACDNLTSLNGKIAGGRRVNISKIFNVIDSPTNVKATQGTSTTEVTVTWNAVSGASYYQVYRATSENAADSAKTVISGGTWLNNRTSYSDTTAAAGTTYWYWVKAATSSSGANSSAFSSPAASGWKKVDSGKYPDSWDPDDNTLDGATVLTPKTTKQTHGQHGLVNTSTSTTYLQDKADVFKIYMTNGSFYVFESSTVGGASETKDLYAFIDDSQGNLLALNDDGASNGYDFKLVYKARETGYHYLVVAAYSNTPEIFYNLSYYIGSESDRQYGYVDFNDIAAAGGTCTLNCTSNGSVPWVFERPGRPSWISDMTLQLPNGTSMNLTGTGTTAVDFEGEAKLIVTIDANTTATARKWETLNVILDMDYQVRFYQQAASTLAAPTNVQASDGNTNNITVTWNAVTGATHYRVARAESASGTKTYFSWQTARTYTDTNVNSGATYWYWVQAAKSATGDSASPLSNYDTGTRGTPSQTKYKLTVNNGTGSGEYVEGQKVTISANNAPVGKVFSQWTGNVSYVANPKSATTTVTMPAKNIAVTAEYSATNTTDPFDGVEPVTYPSIQPQLVYVSVSFDGHSAVNGDWLAAYCGQEMRGKVKLDDGGNTWLLINTSKTGETIRFVGYDANSDAFLDCTTTIKSEAGREGTTVKDQYGKDKVIGIESDPLKLQFNNRDPFGTPVAHPEASPLLLTAKVTVNDIPAEVGDIVAVKCGNELRGRATVDTTNGIVVMQVSRAKYSGEVLTFWHWSSDTEEVKQALFSTSNSGTGADSYTTVSGKDELGTSSSPVYLKVSDKTRMTFNFIKGWNAFSLNVATDDCTIQEFFGSNLSKVERIDLVRNGVANKIWMPGGTFTQFTTMEPGVQYWVRMSAACTVQWDGKPIGLDEINSEGEPYNKFVFKVGWNSLPYLPQNDSELKQTLNKLFSDVTVERVTSSSGGAYVPSDPKSQTLTTMKGGEVYWVRITDMPGAQSIFSYSKPTLQSTQQAMALQSALSSIYPQEWLDEKIDIANDAQLNRNIVVNLDCFGSRNCKGISIAAYRVNDNAFVGKATFEETEAFPPSGEYVAKISVQQDIDTEVYFKLWDSGDVEAPYDQPWVLENQTFVLEYKDDDEDGQQDDLEVSLVASGETPRYKIEFVLEDGDYTATQTDDVALIQYIPRGGAATPPVISVPKGYVADPWNYQEALYTNVTQQAVVKVNINYSGISNHAADINGNWKIDVEELNRVITLYLSPNGYCIDPERQGMNGFDGFDVGDGDRNGICHSADLNGNWKIDVEELNRVITLYLANGYEVDETVQPDSQHDGYKVKSAR